MSGVRCPAPLVGAKQVVNDLSSGEVPLLVSDCPGTKDGNSKGGGPTGRRRTCMP
jgi:TusA-related sulfurtransferase